MVQRMQGEMNICTILITTLIQWHKSSSNDPFFFQIQKNFRPWAAFGDKGRATKCVGCRDRQREKYALQKEEKERQRGLCNKNNNHGSVPPMPPMSMGMPH